MGRFKEQFMARLMDRLENEADSIGVEMTEDIRDKISTPVVRNDNGIVIQRSPVGDYPWLETGHLKASQRHEISHPAATTVTLTLSNDAHYSRRLQTTLSRPFFALAFADWRALIGPRLLAAMAGKR